MSVKLAFGIKKHAFFDFIIVPYLIKEVDGKNFFTLISRLNKNDIESYPFLNQKQIRSIFENTNKLTLYELNKKYNKKHDKISFETFFSRLGKNEKKSINEYVYFVKDIIVSELEFIDPVLFLFERQKENYFDNDVIKISKEKLKLKFCFSKVKTDSAVKLKYKLQVFLNNKVIPLSKSKVLNNTNPLLVYKNIAYFFENKSFNGNKLKPFYDKDAILVPERLQETFFDKFVKYALDKYPYEIKGFEIIHPEIVIKPILDIEKTINHKIIFSLSFEYADKKVLFYQSNTVFSKIIQNKDKFLIEQVFRKKQQENEYIKVLKELGFTKKDKFFVLDELVNDTYAILKKYAGTFNRLKNIGFKINNRLLKKESVFEKEQIISKIILNRDWFDINIQIKIKEFTIPFIAFKNHILNKKHEYILPDNTVFILPETWFSELTEFAKRTTNSNNIKIHKQSYNLLKKQQILQLNNNIAERIKKLDKIPEIEVPKTIQANLRNYQVYGYHWLYNRIKNNFGVCLADDMGLGKTLQVITVLQQFFDENTASNINLTTGQLDLFSTNDFIETVLLVLPRVLIQNWKNELLKFAPELSFFSFYGSDRKEKFLQYFNKKHIAITSYGVVRNDIEFLKNYSFSFVILDESHLIKNPKSLVFKAIMQLNSLYRISITGTPFENKLSDIWAQFHFLNPKLLGDFSFFNKEYIQKIKNNPNAIEVSMLQNIIQPFILRRLKEEVAKELPDKIEQDIVCQMTADQYDFYERELSIFRNEFLKTGIAKNKIKVLAGITKLRQIALHPRLVEINFKSDSGKFLSMISVIENLIEQRHKFIVFSSYVRFLKLFKDYFEQKNIPFKMLTGKTKNPQLLVRDFNNQTDIFPFLISIKAGGVGLNITSANYVLISDPWWNPFIENQAIDRTHRIGQTKNVFVYRFISKNTIEEKIQIIQKEKQALSKALLNESVIDLDDKTLLNLFSK